MFNNLIVIGSGNIAYKIADYFKQKVKNLVFIENKNTQSLSIENLCIKNNIKFLSLSNTDISNFLELIFEPTLIISASNRYIFPEKIINKLNFFIVNYHSSLLPKYPGRNAEAWAIFNEDEIGGVTWHKVEKRVDKGDIISQKKILISENTTSFLLLKTYADLAFNAITELQDDLLNGSCKFIKQENIKNNKFYFASEIPNNGFLDKNWNAKKMSAFLRAMDYGPLFTLGVPKIKYNDRIYEIGKYKIERCNSITDKFEFNKENMLIEIYKQDYKIVLSKLILKNEL